MSDKTSIDKVILDFIMVYKRYKDKNMAASRKEGDEKRAMPGRGSRSRERLDKHPCP